MTILMVPVLVGFLQAQQPADTAPVPTQISTATRIFIANAPPVDRFVDPRYIAYSGGPYRFYSQFIMAIKTWGRFELASTPADADLVFEVRFVGNVPNQLDLVIVDPKSSVPLWWFAEPLRTGTHRQDSDKLFDQAMSKLVQDVKDLVSTTPGKVSAEPSNTVAPPV